VKAPRIQENVIIWVAREEISAKPGRGDSMKKMWLAVLVVCAAICGCADSHKTYDSVLLAGKSGEGVAREYPVPVNEACAVARAVFRWEQVDSVDENCPENYMIASSGMKMAACGTVMGVWLKPVGHGKTGVTVVARNRGNCYPFTHLTPNEFFKRFEQGLDIIGSGKPLPFAAPK
jgi:hypothetical protein